MQILEWKAYLVAETQQAKGLEEVMCLACSRDVKDNRVAVSEEWGGGKSKWWPQRSGQVYRV